MQALNGGKATWFGIEVPFDITALLGIVSQAVGRRGQAYAVLVARGRRTL